MPDKNPARSCLLPSLFDSFRVAPGRAETKKLKHEDTKRMKRHEKDIQPFSMISRFLKFRAFVFSSLRKQAYPVRRAVREIRIQYSLAFVKLKSSPKGEGFSRNPRMGQSIRSSPTV
jgi:hypothetical protein